MGTNETIAAQAGWFNSENAICWERTLVAAEMFADGLIDRSTLIASKHTTGGAWNLFIDVAGLRRLTPERVMRDVTVFSREFHTPAQSELFLTLLDVFGDPTHPVRFCPDWRTSTAVGLADAMYQSREFASAPILADALEEAGCDEPLVLDHLRGPGPHVRGCWAVDLVLGKA